MVEEFEKKNVEIETKGAVTDEDLETVTGGFCTDRVDHAKLRIEPVKTAGDRPDR